MPFIIISNFNRTQMFTILYKQNWRINRVRAASVFTQCLLQGAAFGLNGATLVYETATWKRDEALRLQKLWSNLSPLQTHIQAKVFYNHKQYLWNQWHYVPRTKLGLSVCVRQHPKAGTQPKTSYQWQKEMQKINGSRYKAESCMHEPDMKGKKPSVFPVC